MTTAGSNFISGITTTVFATTDVVNKDYVDANVPLIPSQTGNAGEFLITTDGTSLSWDYVSNYQEFTTPGAQTFNVPSYANLLYIEAVGAGGGGQSGGTTWKLRTSGTTANLNFFNFSSSAAAGGDSGVLITATDTIIWQLRTSGFSFGAIRASLDVGSEILLGGDHAFIRTSTDAIVWTAYISNNGVNSIYAFGPPDLNGVYTVGGANGYLAASNQFNVSTWNLRTSGTTNTIYALAFGAGDTILSFNAAGTNGLYAVSTNSIVWTLRTSGFGASAIRALSSDGNIAAGDDGKLATTTNSIVWTLRTSGFGASAIRALSSDGYIAAGDGGLVMATTDLIVWTSRNSPITSNINDLDNVFGSYFAGDNGTIGYYNPQPSGAGGASGSYTSWYIPKSIVSSNITVNPGAGGYGSTIELEIGGLGGNTTVSWTGTGGTYTLTSNGGFYNTLPGSAQVVTQSSYYYTTSGLQGASGSTGAGTTATAQTNQFQPTGGGSGTGSLSFAGGSGGAINVYGISTSASGGTSSGSNGSAGIAYTGLPYGSGGGGGGASVSIAATGGNGVRGGGGGGGASGNTSFGNGGNGGDGYVKITWW